MPEEALTTLQQRAKDHAARLVAQIKELSLILQLIKNRRVAVCSHGFYSIYK